MGVRRKRQGQADVIERYAGSGLSRLVPAVEDELVQQETVTRLRELLDKLPPDQRDVVERRMHREQTFAEIAAELNLPLGTVLTRMRLATQRLQRWLKSNE
jgi:RNA polymerase sigma factor (sigma-70 family)